jgi:hypothetical protein
MSDLDAYEDEMGRFSRLNDRELDRLLAGQGPVEDGDFVELATFFRELNVVFQEAPDGPTEIQHLTAIMDAVLLLPGADAPPVASTVERLFLRSRGAWSGRTSRAARVAFAVVLALGAFCGVAYAGALPGPVQGAVADVARNVGVSLPGAHNNKDDRAQNDKHDITRSKAPVGTQTHTNTGAETNGQGTQTNNHDAGAQQKDNHGAQNANSGAEHNGNEGGTNGAAGNTGQNNPGEGSQGSVNTTPQAGQGLGNQGDVNPGDGNQGNGSN